MKDDLIYDMLIIGGGPAGYTAAIYAARAGLDAVVLEKLSAGGQMALTEQIDNYPGFEEGIDGFTLAEKMQAQAVRFGVQTEYAEVFDLDLTSEPKKAQTSEGIFYGRTVVLATGAGPKKLGLPGEESLTGRGVAYCASCDGMFYKGKTVAVIGGGNSAVSDALLLSRIAARVILIHRRSSLRADKIYHKAMQDAPNIEFRWNSRVTSLLQEGSRLAGLGLQDVNSGEESILACDGAFIGVGGEPQKGLAGGRLSMDENGYIIADETTATSIPGVYAAGDVRTKSLRQVVTAMADGAAAVHEAQGYLASGN